MPNVNLIPKDFSDAFLKNLESLKHFDFSLNNPVFWLFMALLFLILLKIWVAKKAFIFTVLIAIILLLTTLAEERFIHLLSPTNESLNLWLVRFMAVVIVACLSFLFLFFG